MDGLRPFSKMTDELSPIFVVQVWLDGDDYSVTATENAKNRLTTELQKMKDDRVIVHFRIRTAHNDE